jgi:hypothetical protein
MPDAGEACDCELPGAYCSGIPGVIAAMKNGRLAPGAAVERCDLCQRFPTEEAALSRLKELGLADTNLEVKSTFTVHCFVEVSVTFPDVVATDPRDAARQITECFHWKLHRDRAEFTDVTELLVDTQGDEAHFSTQRFLPDLSEIDSEGDIAPAPA